MITYMLSQSATSVKPTERTMRSSSFDESAFGSNRRIAKKRASMFLVFQSERPSAVSALIEGLASAEKEALLVSIRVLGRMGTEGASALPDLERLQGHADEKVAAAAAASVERLRAVADPK